ncbi:uromodulin-like [Ambystoma mexicanum]|uniref:uromodulin-like n=1 Tax=Ambystoma mexicanum TaxID=8296 RepID=UPI0037E95F81
MNLLLAPLLVVLLRGTEQQTCNPTCASDEVCTTVSNSTACACNTTTYANSTYADLVPNVNCGAAQMVVSVGKCLTQKLHNAPQNMFLADANCTGANTSVVNGINMYSIQNEPKTNACGNVATVNATHVTYSNMVHIPPYKTASGLTLGRQVDFAFACTYKLTMQTSLATVLRPIANTVGLSTGGTGTASTIMAAYSNPSYTSPIQTGGQSMSIGSTIYFGMSTQFADADVFVLRVDTCYATPTEDPNSSTREYLIQNGCPANGNVHTAVVSNGETLEVRFSVESFAFESTSSAYIYCSARLCYKAQGQCAGCQPTSARSENSVLASATFGLGPFYFQDSDVSGSNPQTAVFGCVLGGGLLALLSLRLL